MSIVETPPPSTSGDAPQHNGEVEQFRTHFESAGASRPYPMTSAEVLFGILAVFGWIAFFAGGTVVGTEDSRTLIANGKYDSFGDALMAWATVITCYTITNVATLSCLAAIAGQFSSRSRESELSVGLHRSTHSPEFRDLLAYYASAAMRGFVSYLLIVSGLLLVTTEAMAQADQNQYVRLAGTMSVVSFIAGYDPVVFKQALERIVALISQAPREAPKPPLLEQPRGPQRDTTSA